MLEGARYRLGDLLELRHPGVALGGVVGYRCVRGAFGAA
jgi:hypothetical protein